MFDKYGVCCLVDTGFGKIENDFIVKSTQDDLSLNKMSHKEEQLDVRLKNSAISMW